MTEGADAATPESEREELVGVRISSGLLMATGFFFGVFPAFYVVMLCVSWSDRLAGRPSEVGTLTAPVLLSAMLICAAIATACVMGGKAMWLAKKWSSYLATTLGAVLLILSVYLVVDMVYPADPERQAPDGGYVLLLVPFFLMIGAWWCIYLNLPHVRAYFRQDVRR